MSWHVEKDGVIVLIETLWNVKPKQSDNKVAAASVSLTS